MKKRLNIGLLIDNLDNHFSNEACKGAEMAAKAMDANLFVFPGHYIGIPDTRYGEREFEYQYNSVFGLANKQELDILYILVGVICSRATYEEQIKFVKRFTNVPVVTLFCSIPGYNTVTFDNKPGFAEMLNHLFKDHNVKKIGYVSGPEANRDAIERFDIFMDTVKNAGIEVTSNQIVYGDFTEKSEDYVGELLDRNRKLDAIVCANDCMAVGAYKAVRDRGMTPGKDIIITGFDGDSISITMDPPLTTVEASSDDLTYKAIMNARNFINSSDTNTMAVETFPIIRNSCGCKGLDAEGMRIRLNYVKLESGDRKFISSTNKYLFGIFEDDGILSDIKRKTEAFCTAYADFLESDASEDKGELMDEAMKVLMNTDVFAYATPERLYNVLETMQYEANQYLANVESKLKVSLKFTSYFRYISFTGSNLMSTKARRMDRLTRLVNTQTGELFNMSTVNDIAYENLIDGFTTVGFNQSFIYLFQGNVKSTPESVWKMPNTMLLRALCDSDGARVLPEEQQLVRTNKLFNNEFIDQKDRITMIMQPLFVGDELYGMFLTETEYINFDNLSPVARQLSVTLKSLFLIEEQNEVKKSLQNSLEQFIRDNSLLDAISKSDELTGLYNRRGFLDYAQKAIADPANTGKMALVCYADMDNLKMVNDVYGHDEGDFALREISSVLNDVFRSTDIIGRIGGDEFVAFAMIGVEHYEATIKTRIIDILKKHNEAAGKPYPIDMSTGIHEFTCDPSVNIYEILDLADEKLYNEKKAKKEVNGSYR